MQTLKIAKTRPSAILPTRKHPQDAGIDLYVALAAEIPPLSHGIVPTGVTIEIPPGHAGLVKPKGRSNHLLGAGVVDAGYQGEILIKVFNPTPQPLHFQPGDAIAQMLIIPILTPAVVEVDLSEIHQSASSRAGTGGIVEQYS